MTLHLSRIVGALALFSGTLAVLVVLFDCWLEATTVDGVKYEFSITQTTRDGEDLKYRDYTDGEDFFPEDISTTETRRFLAASVSVAMLILFGALFAFVAFTTLCFRVPRLTSIFFAVSAVLMLISVVLYYAIPIRFVEQQTDTFASSKGRESFYCALGLVLSIVATLVASMLRAQRIRKEIVQYSTRDRDPLLRPHHEDESSAPYERSPQSIHNHTSSHSLSSPHSPSENLSSAPSAVSGEVYHFPKASRHAQANHHSNAQSHAHSHPHTHSRSQSSDSRESRTSDRVGPKQVRISRPFASVIKSKEQK
eukprot:TRINITY_DN4215_c0_g1_i1.p1 TRINITY_DN4215_c0_g1~~TRINITY_DN4215_c0_g1_i1.p1  ORF type:complete len:310 (+),score=58.83 TRINITY_DN4215_c0_g1_i1:58-987(+)